MIGIVLVSHGALAQEFATTLEHIVGKQDNLMSIGLSPTDDIEAKREEISKAILAVDQGKGVVVLTDMFGGTPSNLAHSLLDQHKIEIIAGMNLPLLIKLATLRSTTPLSKAVLLAQEAGQKYIHVASRILKKIDAKN